MCFEVKKTNNIKSHLFIFHKNWAFKHNIKSYLTKQIKTSNKTETTNQFSGNIFAAQKHTTMKKSRIFKNNKTLKLFFISLMTCAATLVFVQCRQPKFDEIIWQSHEIKIKFTAGGSAKTDINVDDGRITWNDGDKVYVVHNGKLMGGYLTATPLPSDARIANISGTVTTGETIGNKAVFNFYYVGKGVEFNNLKGDMVLTFDISDQYGHNGATLNDVGEYQVGRTDTVNVVLKDGVYIPALNYAKSFRPLTAVLRVDTETSFDNGGSTMTVNGADFGNIMNIDLSSPENPTYTDGTITFVSGADTRIAALPTTASTNAVITFLGNGRKGDVTVKNGIAAGKIYAKILDNTVYPIPVVAKPLGILPGLFSVANGKQVQFSQGNLQYIGSASTPYWRFADNQWDILGTSTNQNSDLQNVDRDLFGYGTSGYNGIMPYMTSTSPSAYPSVAFTGENVNYDWGVFNAISNGGNSAGLWRTLNNTMPDDIGTGGDWHCHGGEWDYLIYDRDNNSAYHSEGKYLSGTGTLTLNNLTEVFGVFLLPDNYYDLPGAKQQAGSKFSWTYTQAEITQYNIVFLPRAGGRSGTTVNTDNGNYWSSSNNPKNADRACNIWFDATHLIQTGSTPSFYKQNGYAVRVVVDVD